VLHQTERTNHNCEATFVRGRSASEQPLELQTIELAGKPARPGDTVRLLGWGITEPDGSGPLPAMLQELDTKVVPVKQCALPAISGEEICTNNPHGTDGPCNGDSGGPALKKEEGRWKSAGGTSRSNGRWCGVDKAVYTSSPDYRQWIYDTARGTPVAASAVPVKKPGLALPYERPAA
jgi:hypothetical protein